MVVIIPQKTVLELSEDFIYDANMAKYGMKTAFKYTGTTHPKGDGRLTYLSKRSAFHVIRERDHAKNAYFCLDESHLIESDPVLRAICKFLNGAHQGVLMSATAKGITQVAQNNLITEVHLGQKPSYEDLSIIKETFDR